MIMTFEEWYEENEDLLEIEYVESGAIRELDFDPELEVGLRYEACVRLQEAIDAGASASTIT